MADPLPLGPAFIAYRAVRGNDLNPATSQILRWHFRVPPGYVWRPATNGTMAGWIRPSGGKKDAGLQ